MVLQFYEKIIITIGNISINKIKLMFYKHNYILFN